MIEMTPEIKIQLLKVGRNSVDNSKTDYDIINKLLENSREVIENNIGKKELSKCELHYIDSRNPELLIWATGLICMRWTLYLLKQKSIDGHCNTHKRQTGLLCLEGKKFHDDLFNEAKKSFEELLIHDYETEIKNVI